jgi:putative membrane protein
MLLDIVIDPVALQGQRWFLGRIYGYQYEGFYFGIPMSNFGGWLLVGAVLTGALQVLERLSYLDSKLHLPSNRSSWMRLIGPALYFSVLLFNISVTFYIGETLLGLVDVLLFATLLVPMVFFTLYKNSNVSVESVSAFVSRGSSITGEPRSFPLNPDPSRHLDQHRGWDLKKSGH